MRNWRCTNTMCMLGLKILELFCEFFMSVLGFSNTKNYGLMYQSPSFSERRITRIRLKFFMNVNLTEVFIVIELFKTSYINC